MPLDDIQKVKSIDERIGDNIAKWEQQSVADIALAVAMIGEMSKEDAEKYDAKKEAKKLWSKIAIALAVVIKKSAKEMQQGYNSEFETWQAQSKPLYDYRGKTMPRLKSKGIKDIMNAYSKQSLKDMINLTNTKALKVFDRNGNTVSGQDGIYKAFSEAVKNITAGRTDFHLSMRQTIEKLGGGGCRVDYGNGVTRRLDTVVRQNMLWGIKQAHREYNALVGQDIGADGIEIDYHTNSRPSHRYMQGKQYSKGDGKTVNGIYYPSAEKEGVYDRLYSDYGCRHYETDIILGVSVPRYTDEELKRFEQNDKRLYKIGDIEKDGYGWSQAMRALETEIRKSKDEINALKALGGNEARIGQLQDRIKACRSKYDEISDVTGIRADMNRLRVAKPNIASGVADSGNKSPITPITDAAINSVKKVNISGFTDSQNDYIQGQHKELLRYARDNNDSNEVAFVFRKDLTDRTVFKGSDDVVDFGNGLNGKGDGLFVMHNHPRNSSFSDRDLKFIISENDIKALSIVKNNGKIELLIKSENYNAEMAKAYLSRAYKKFVRSGTDESQVDRAIQYFLNHNGGSFEWTK